MWGLILIFVILALFLRLRLAFWTAIGIPIAFCGAIWLLPLADATINMMSLFGFIVVLGIMVDDAIVVGENIHYHSRLGKPGPQAAKDGTREVMLPVVLAVLTTIAAFIPMLTMPGTMGQFARVIPVVVICALAFSLVESLFILPKHLSHMKPAGKKGRSRGLDPTGLLSRALDWFVARAYRPALGFAMRWRYLTLAAGLSILVLTVGLIVGGYVKFNFFPPIAGDQVIASLRMPEGTPVEVTQAAVERLREGVEEVRRKYEETAPGRVVKHVLVSVGTRPQDAEVNWEQGGGAPSGSNLGEVFVELHSPEALGITQAELARQVRQGFYGDEAQRIQRGRDDVKVMVRYPREERRSLADLDNMRIRTPGGGEVPFSTVARAVLDRGPAVIRRADGSRSVRVSADVDLAVANPNEINAELRASFLPELEAGFPGLTSSFEGEQREQAETMGGLLTGAVLAALFIFTLLALAFQSFIQPIIVLTAVPFGMVGAVLGHMWLGKDLSLMSTIGLLAMAGVVVNDSMIMVDFVNRARARGASAWEAVSEAGPRRFRPILLTSLTTFAGLAPLLLETSVQAQFLIPMAISLSFGVLFSTLVILFIVPSSYLVLEDITGLLRRLRRIIVRREVEAVADGGSA